MQLHKLSFDQSKHVSMSIIRLPTDTVYSIIIHFSFFADNHGPNGVVSIGYAPAIFRGLTHFSNNQGASLRVCLYSVLLLDIIVLLISGT